MTKQAKCIICGEKKPYVKITDATLGPEVYNGKNICLNCNKIRKDLKKDDAG